MIFPGISQFRPGQDAIIESILKGRDVLAVLPTGGGKSLCYQYPSYKNQGLVIVISPLIALMKDQVDHLKAKGLCAEALYSGQEYGEKIEIFKKLKKGGQFLLYLSPERVQKSGFRQWIQNQNIILFAVDEAHCVSQWGHDFREEYAALSDLKKWRPDVPLLALTASATPLVLEDIAKQLGLKKYEKKVYGFYRPNLYYQVEDCLDDEEKYQWVISALEQTQKGRIIIYCGTRKVTENLSSQLVKKFSGVSFYHAGLSSQERKSIQEAYRQGDYRILVATNAFGMGIDQPDVRLVIHYQLPSNIDSLYQEMGRAGRDNEPATCLLLYSKKDKGLQSFFITSSEASPRIKSLRWNNLETLLEYAEGGDCRHSDILTYFQDQVRIKSCGHCDICDPTSDKKIVKLKNSQKNKKTEIKSKIILKKSELLPFSDWDQDEFDLFETLRAWRKSLSQKKDVPAFTILSDKSLRSLVQERPETLEDLKKIYGFGDSKIQHYGADVLDLIGKATPI